MLCGLHVEVSSHYVDKMLKSVRGGVGFAEKGFPGHGVNLIWKKKSFNGCGDAMNM